MDTRRYSDRASSGGRPREGGNPSWKEEGAWESILNFFGIGPQKYRRSDLSLFEEVCETLARHPEVEAGDIEVEAKDGLITLSGTVPSYFMKRKAEDCLDDISGVTEVVNRLEVVSDNTLASHSAAPLQSTSGKPL